MKNLLIFTGVVGVLAVASCEQHEIIPPPVPLVELNCSCDAVITGGAADTTLAYGDTCTYSSIKTIGTPGTSSARYFSNIDNEGFAEGVQLEIRALEWTDDGSNKPTLNEWQNFFNANTEPKYYPEVNDPLDAVVVRWTDKNGTVWTSDSSIVCLSDFKFNWFVQESDTTGDYMKFDATFSCTLWDPSMTTSRCLQDGHIKSAFRLD